LKEIVQEVEENIYNQNAPTDEEVQDEKVTSLLTDCIQRYTKNFKNMEEKFLDIDYPSFKTKFNDVIQEIKEEVIFYEIPQDLDETLCKLAFEAIKKDYFSIGSTGIVIAGYGESNGGETTSKNHDKEFYQVIGQKAAKNAAAKIKTILNWELRIDPREKESESSFPFHFMLTKDKYCFKSIYLKFKD